MSVLFVNSLPFIVFCDRDLVKCAKPNRPKKRRKRLSASSGHEQISQFAPGMNEGAAAPSYPIRSGGMVAARSNSMLLPLSFGVCPKGAREMMFSRSPTAARMRQQTCSDRVYCTMPLSTKPRSASTVTTMPLLSMCTDSPVRSMNSGMPSAWQVTLAWQFSSVLSTMIAAALRM